MCEILKKLGAVGVAVRCRPSRGCFATPALIPASKIGGISTPILKKVILRKSCQNRPKSRSNPACRVFSPTFSAKPQHGPKFWLTGGVHSKRKRPQDVIPTVFAASYIFFIPFSSTNRTFPGRLFFQPENHPAIIERAIFERVQEEVSQRNSKRKVKEISTKTELGRYSSKYPLTDLLFCGKCGAPHRRTTWSKNSKKKIV